MEIDQLMSVGAGIDVGWRGTIARASAALRRWRERTDDTEHADPGGALDLVGVGDARMTDLVHERHAEADDGTEDQRRREYFGR